MGRDVVVIGASAGSLDVILELAAGLPADLPASIFLVVHSSPAYPSVLPDLLGRRGSLPASHPFHNEAIERGRIYVAPPDMQMLLRPGVIEVVRGPKENGHRPAVDALFRTAARSYAERVVGVVLSGNQDCGTAGMMSIKARGGLVVVQSPETALAPGMPSSVIQRVAVDHVVTPEALPALIDRLAREPATPGGTPGDELLEQEGERPGHPAGIVCPTCHGALTETRAGIFEHFRCHVGHTFSAAALLTAQDEDLERALWSAARALEESAALSERLMQNEPSPEMRLRHVERRASMLQQAELIRRVLLDPPG